MWTLSCCTYHYICSTEEIFLQHFKEDQAEIKCGKRQCRHWHDNRPYISSEPYDKNTCLFRGDKDKFCVPFICTVSGFSSHGANWRANAAGQIIQGGFKW